MAHTPAPTQGGHCEEAGLARSAGRIEATLAPLVDTAYSVSPVGPSIPLNLVVPLGQNVVSSGPETAGESTTRLVRRSPEHC